MNNVNKFGINRLVSSGIYKAAFPLHDVSQMTSLEMSSEYSGADRAGLDFLTFCPFLYKTKVISQGSQADAGQERSKAPSLIDPRCRDRAGFKGLGRKNSSLPRAMWKPCRSHRSVLQLCGCLEVKSHSSTPRLDGLCSHMSLSVRKV